MNTERMTIERWYHGCRIPTRPSVLYDNFAVSCIGLVRTLMREKTGKQVNIRFGKIETAAADPESGSILINQNYLHGLFNGPLGVAYESDATLAAICGIVVHEAAHFAYSRDTLLPYYEYIRKHSKSGSVHQALAIRIGNMVEDVFIEAEVDRQVPNFSWMLGYAHEVMFPEKDRLEQIDASQLITDAPEDLDGCREVFNVLITLRTLDSFKSTPYITSLFTLVKNAAEAGSFEERDELALKIYEEMTRNLNHQELNQEQPSGQRGKGKPQEAEEGNEQGESGQEGKGESKKVEMKSEAGSLSEEKNTTEKKIKIQHGDNQSTGSEIVKINMALDQNKNDSITMRTDAGAFGQYNSRETIFFIERAVEAWHEQGYQADKRYAELAKIGRQRAVVNRPYGEQRSRGTHIRALHRIATDSKIFAQPLPMNDYKPMQVIILLDCSGSMRSGMYDRAARAAMGATLALTEARCDVGLYGHTADGYVRPSSYIYKFKGITESPVSLGEKLLNVEKRGEMWENRDGSAILFVSEKFTNQRKRRLLVVISDGMPRARFSNYDGDVALDHTKEMVDKVRKKGIDVLSISVTVEAQRACNHIYGRENNIYNEDPNCITTVVNRILGV